MSSKRALVCAPLLPEFDREGGSRRVYHFIRFLRDEGWAVTLLCENALRGSERYARFLQQMGVATYVGFGDEATEVVRTGQFDVAIVAFWNLAESYADWIRDLAPETAIVVESVDLHWLRNARHAYTRANGTGLTDEFALEMIREMNVYSRADAVFTVSEKESGLINDVLADTSQAYAVPDCDSIPPSPQAFEARRGLVFVGNYRHPPNVDAVEFLCHEIIPRISRNLMLEHPLYIVGNGLDERVKRLGAGLDTVRMVGWVPSVVPYYHEARVSVVPLRYGAGTKRKLMQAMMAETPSVTTTIGIEGFELSDGQGALIADDGPGFAEAVTRLLQDRELWSRVGREGSCRIRKLHGPEVAKRRFFEALDFVLERRRRLPPKVSKSVPERSRRGFEVDHVRRAVQATVPEGSRVLVVSKGDPELLELGNCLAAHFPQAEDGRYAGYHPKDSASAIEHLEAFGARREADYFVIPGTALWWLDHYSEMARYLEERYARIWSDEHCVIYGPGEAGSRR